MHFTNIQYWIGKWSNFKASAHANLPFLSGGLSHFATEMKRVAKEQKKKEDCLLQGFMFEHLVSLHFVDFFPGL